MKIPELLREELLDGVKALYSYLSRSDAELGGAQLRLQAMLKQVKQGKA